MQITLQKISPFTLFGYLKVKDAPRTGAVPHGMSLKNILIYCRNFITISVSANRI